MILQVGNLVTTMHGDVSIQMGQGVLVQCQDQVDLGILLGHAHILGMLLKLPVKLSCCHPCLVHHGYAQMQVELITLEPVPDVFNYLPLGGIAAICLSSPINLCHPQHATSLQPRINIQVHCQMSHVVDGCWS